MTRVFIVLFAFLTTILICACGGSTNTTWEEAINAIENSNIENTYVIIGNGNEQLLSYEKGTFSSIEAYSIASASKLLSSILAFTLIEQGSLSLSDQPQDHIDWWASNPDDLRSNITLEHLLSFTSGFNDSPTDVSCISVGNLVAPELSLEECVERRYDNGLDLPPGTAFSYGPEHLQIAGLMAEQATGMSYAELLESQLIDTLQLSNATENTSPTQINPRVAGGAQSSAEDYALILQSLLNGSLISNIELFIQDRTPSTGIAIDYKPDNVIDDWHYALGAWRFCPESNWDDSCEQLEIISSPGAFGWTPWVDFERGYYGLITMDDRNGDGAASAVELMEKLMPIISTNLD